MDLRDPKLIVTPDEKRLYLLCGGDSATLGRQTRYATSMDGKVWTPLQKLLAKGDWLAMAQSFCKNLVELVLLSRLRWLP